MIIWRLVADKVATLTELETTYSIDDVLRLNAVQDMRAYHLKKEIKKGK